MSIFSEKPSLSVNMLHLEVLRHYHFSFTYHVVETAYLRAFCKLMITLLIVKNIRDINRLSKIVVNCSLKV